MYVVMVTDLGAVKAKSGVACLALWSLIKDRQKVCCPQHWQAPTFVNGKWTCP